MDWNLSEAISYYKSQGAPADQNALVNLLREVQAESGGSVPRSVLPEIADSLGTKESLLLALIRRYPSLRLADTHTLELCGGPNCPRKAPLAAFVEKTWGTKPRGFTVKQVPCMRLCGKGPNIKWDGKLYHNADEALLQKLIGEALK